MKMLKVGDLHLHTKEMRSTKKLVENNNVMLKGILDFLLEEQDIELLTFMGDIQHATPKGKNTLQETVQWTERFMQIGEEVKGRYQHDRVRVIMETEQESKEISDKISKGLVYPMFTLKGNHDIDNEVDYTYYDDLIEKGILINPRALIIDGTTQVNFFNYGEADREWEKEDGVEQVIGLYHDVIATEESPFWVGKHTAYKDSEVLVGTDLAVVAHIHQKSDPIYVDTVTGGRSVCWYMGSMGRTSISQGQVRDVGYCAMVSTEDIEQLGTVEIDVIPKEEYFNLKEAMKRKEDKKTYENFRLGLEDTVMTAVDDPRDIIRGLELEKGVMSVCIDILDEVVEG